MPDTRRARRFHTLVGVIVTALIGIVGWFLSLPRDLRPLDSSAGGRFVQRIVDVFGFDPVRISYDWSYSFPFAPDSPPKNITMIYVDDNTYRDLGGTTVAGGKWLDRRYYATAIHKLKEYGAKVIALDFWYDPSMPTPESDQALAEAIARHGKVVVVKHSTELSHTEVRGTTALSPLDVLLKAGAHPGFPVVLHSGDGMVRSFRNGTPEAPGFAWVCARLAGGVRGDPPGGSSYIHYYCPPSRLPSVNLGLFIQKDQDPNFFKDRYVFIGSLPKNQMPTAQSVVDEFQTPQEKKVPGIAISAMAFLNIMNRDGLTRLTPGYEFLLLLVLGGALGGGLVWLRPGWATVASVVSFFLIFLISSMLVWRTHVFWAWFFTAGFQLPIALAWAILAYQRRLKLEKDTLEVTLSETLKEVEETRSRQKAAAAAGSHTPASGPVPRPDTSPAPAPAVAASSDSPPSHVADHELIRRVGKGGYGEVWLARNAVGLFHVIKLVFRQEFRDAGPYEREFRGIQRFMPISRSHPGFVHILHVGRSEDQGMFYCVMEAGDDEKTGTAIDPETYSPKNLAGQLRTAGALPVKECLSLGIALASALEKLHQQNLIHRDIKPSNIIYVAGQPKLADIGLVTEIQSTAHDVSRLGTDGFIAPEGPGTPASDVYSLGKVLYEACMGLDRRRFPELPTALYDSPDAAQRTRLNRIILQACEPSPEDRYPDASAMKLDLEKLAKDLGL